MARPRALRATSTASTTVMRLSPEKTRSAAFWLASSAVPGAMAACALARAPASLSPSPTISTLRPSRVRSSTIAALSVGVQPARHWTTPAAGAQRRDRLGHVGPQRVDEGEADADVVFEAEPQLGLGGVALHAKEGGLAQPAAPAIDEPFDTLARILGHVLGQGAVTRRLGQGMGQGMARGAGQRRSHGDGGGRGLLQARAAQGEHAR